MCLRDPFYFCINFRIRYNSNGEQQSTLNSAIVFHNADRQLNSIAFVKTFKTGSSTLAGILARYGYERNLSFALPKEAMFLSFEPFNRKTSKLLSLPKPPGFHILNSHAIFNKSGFQEIMRPETKYITILRNPLKNFYSFIVYFNALTTFNFTGDIFSPDFPMQSFLDVVGTKRHFRSGLLHNGQMFSLGFDTYTQSNNAYAVANKIRELDLELDLVLINEYFDESLIILKKMMCWQFEDILYVSQKISKKKYNFPEEHATLLKNWTAADNALYYHFNHTLWKKIEAYGATFKNDLTHFKLLNQNVNNICFREVISTNGDYPLPNLSVQNDNWTQFCIDIKRESYPYTILIRNNFLRNIK
ncbi:putative galactosylceramide sulfotransferase isoform X2 [Apostichopus japonicus]|uniref:Putative galactosylceramide sulfotransferase isoform X2 n=1 Tax=Stichopus japonicus TaxID=307972 RepID=A0A2G8KCW2_STIJA|nr:putative galactosylceramide sulfotransferase isoform X2 [Apostichopus japonicus]